MPDGADKLLDQMVGGFSLERAVDWLRVKFPSFDTSRAEPLDCAATKNERDYFAEARLLGFVTRMPEDGTTGTNGTSGTARTSGTKAAVADVPEVADVPVSQAASPTAAAFPAAANRPLVVAAIRMKRELTERTSRLVQFNYSKKVLQGAIAKGSLGFSGIPSQGLFFFHGAGGCFRLSLVTAEVEKRKLKWNEAKRQSFFIEPDAANNIVRRRLADPIRSFADLKNAFSVEQLTKEFYRKLFDWYSWAMEPATNVHFPNDLADDRDDRKYNNEAVIRLITRLMFTWFIRQRKLVPDELFDREGVARLLKSFDPDSMEQDNYYRAILQNLFFATFNCPPAKRRFIHTFHGKSAERHVTTLYRHEREFKGGDGCAFRDVMRTVPFLNCALFDCLDKKEREEDGGRELYFDGFSGEKGHSAHVPNGLFFDDERGIISLFSRYEFTVNENDADDSDVALDPELLGKVFENLLGAFNPETQETARKATGSFYTPREIVDYMVEESLKGYLRERLAGTTRTTGTSGTTAAVPDVPVVPDVSEPPAASSAASSAAAASLAAALDDLFDRNKAAEGAPTLFSKDETAALLDALYNCKVLDPACGSGAFPMGVLHCMVRLLTRLDPQNLAIRERLLKRYREDKERLAGEESPAELEARLREGQHFPDYERKLFLIENCIYGVDIQPIATQISKLRFFISLLCDQLRTSYDPSAENFGLLSLPNLEAKFVCANTLISLPEIGALDASAGDIAQLRRDLQENRHKIFSARSTNTKEKYKARDLEIRDAIRKEVRDSLCKPDEAAIRECRKRIADAEKRRKAVAEPDWFEEYENVQADLFSAFERKKVRKDRNEKERNAIDAEIRFAKDRIAKEEAKGDVSNVGEATRYADMVAGWDPYDQNKSEGWFDPEWMFNITGGFDVVIGNPPYINVESMPDADKAYYRANYTSFYKRSDLFALFVEVGLTRFAGGCGALAFIIPSVVHSNLSYKPLRALMLDNRWLREICYTGGDVFDAPTVDTTIILCQKPESPEIRLRHAVDFANPKDYIVPAGYFAQFQNVISVEGGEKVSIFAKLLANESFRTVADDFNVFQGIVTGNNPAFIFESAADAAAHGIEKKLLHPLCLGRDIERYAVRSRERRIMYLSGDFSLKDYPNAGQWLKPFKAALSKRREALRGVIPWYSLQWPRVKSELDTREKILVQNTRNESLPVRIAATLDDKGVYATQGVNFIIPTTGKVLLRYLLGVLNSKLINFLFQTKFLNLAIKAEYLKQIRLPPENAEIAGLVDRILAAKKADPAADTSALESEIDALVYQLYGLTDDEIAIVEGKDKAAQEAAVPAAAPTQSRKRSRAAKQAEADDEEDEVLE